MSVLDSIIEGVREDLADRRISMAQIHEQIEKADPALDAMDFLRGENLAIIAEIKRSSPSKGELARIADPASLGQQYQSAGANAISVLTERRRFGGSLEDLDAVRQSVSIPILRKDFMVDEYQFYEARAHGADIVLLIVAALSKNQIDDFYKLTIELGMSALVEVHTNEELESALGISPDIIGINSRNLKTLEVDRKVFANLIPRLPENIVRVAESGISTRADVEFAQKHGANAILVGEALVRAENLQGRMRELRGLGRL